MTHAQPPAVTHGEADTPVWKAVLLMVSALALLGTLLTAISLGAASIFG